jgi:hypothetical protein
MKTTILFLTITILLAAQCGFGAGPNKKVFGFAERIEIAKGNCVMGMKSENDGLVKGCIALAAKIKLRIPSTDIEEIEKMLTELSEEHFSPVVRYEAYIALQICNDPEWFAEDTHVTTAENEQFFIAAANRLQQKLFGLNSL